MPAGFFTKKQSSLDQTLSTEAFEGFVTKVNGSNVYITSMTKIEMNLPLWKTKGKKSWRGSQSKMTPFFIDVASG